MARGISVPRPGIEAMLPAVEAWSLNRWTAREVLPLFLRPVLFAPWTSLHFFFFFFFNICSKYYYRTPLIGPETLVMLAKNLPLM